MLLALASAAVESMFFMQLLTKADFSSTLTVWRGFASLDLVNFLLDLKWIDTMHSLNVQFCFRKQHLLILILMINGTSGNPDLDIDITQVGQGVTVPASLALAASSSGELS